ncbi:MAG: hypothetical protein JXA73_10565 [Acidobacteria bacterium]|nr:hypothetical protein [Acidobacteriota bacterium]
MINRQLKCIAICLLACSAISIAAEQDDFRLLSVSESEKLILVSHIPSKTKYLLDATAAKITVNGKPAEFKSLKAFSRIQVKMELRKIDKLGIDLDGVANEIKVSTKDEPQ